MKSLDSMSLRFSVVINSPHDKCIYDLGRLIIESKDIFVFYAFIIHDKDINDFGELKTPHIHAVLYYSSRTRIRKVINDLIELLNIPAECISVDIARNDFLSIQYLTHKNDKSKYQYDPNEIFSSDYSQLWYLYNHTIKTELLNDLQIRDIVESCISFEDMILTLGIDYSERHIRTLRVLYDSSHRLKGGD